MKFAAFGLFWLHVAALGLGLFGILVALPHVAEWVRPGDLAFFTWRSHAVGRSAW